MAKNKFQPFDPAAIALGAHKAIGSDDTAIVGIPIPSLAAQFLFNSTVLPLGKMIEIFGPAGAGKSTFLYEIMRWFMDAGGLVYLGETEQKDSVNIRWAVNKYDAAKMDNFNSSYDTTFEKWSSNLVKSIQSYDSLMETYGPTFPVLFAIDAVTSVETEKTIEEYAKDGTINVAYSPLSRNLATLLRELPSLYAKKPYLIAFVNHVKDKIGAMPFTDAKTLPGGKALYFGCHVIVGLSQVKTEIKDGVTTEEKELKLEKSGIQQKKTAISVPLKYYTTPDPSNPDMKVQQIEWDWNTADINFLNDYVNGTGIFRKMEKADEDKKRLSEVLDLNPTRSSRKLAYWSEALGVPESDPLLPAEMGDVLHRNNEVMQKLQGLLITTTGIGFSAGQNYTDVVEEATELQRERYRRISDSLYKQQILHNMEDNS